MNANLPPEAWWSPSCGGVIVPGRSGRGYTRHGWSPDLDELPSDAVRLVPEGGQVPRVSAWREHYECVVRDIAGSFVQDPNVREELVADLLSNLDDSMLTERVRVVSA